MTEATALHAEGRVVIVVMTVWQRRYFDAIAGGLERTAPLRPFVLIAQEETLCRRIDQDLLLLDDREWRLSHLGACLAASRDPLFGKPIATDDQTSGEVAAEILLALRA